MKAKYQMRRNIVAIVGQAEEVFQRLTQTPAVYADLEGKGKQIGGYVTLLEAGGSRVPSAVVGFGFLFIEKSEVCHRLTQEKALRLDEHIFTDRGSHKLSRQSANKQEDKYPGAVFGTHLIISFSGLPADLDEIYSAALLCRLGDASISEMEALLRAHGNAWIDRISFHALARA